MAKRIQLRRGTTTENNAFKGAVGELTYDTEKKQLRVHDGSTVGGKAIDDPIPDATETVAGKAKINNTLTSTATDEALTAAQGKVLQDNKLEKTFAFGVGQSMQDVTSSRAVNTTYTNSTGKPIIVNIAWNYSGGGTNYAKFLVNGTSIATVASQSGSGVSVVVPNGCTYSFSSAGWEFSKWEEYR